MGNTTSVKSNAISALESIRDDAQERWTTVSAELMVIEYKLINRESLSPLQQSRLVKQRADLRRQQKLLKSNIDMANNGLVTIYQKECDHVCKKVEQSSRILCKVVHDRTEVTEEEIDALFESLRSPKTKNL